MSAAWSVHDDPHGCPTIWDERGNPVATLDVSIVLGPEYRDVVWDGLVRLFAPDEATIERLVRALAKSEAVSFDLNRQAFRDHYRRLAETALAALAGTAAQDAEVSE